MIDMENDEHGLRVRLQGDEHVQTFGGEDGSGICDTYGIVIGGVTVYDMSPDQARDLVCKLASHMIICGHEFKIKPGHGEYAKLIHVDR